MRVQVQMLFEDGGRPVPRWRETRAKVVEGDLKICGQYLKEFKRQSVVASLTDGKGFVLPWLIDASILNLIDGSMLLKGMNHDPLTNKVTAQSWFVNFSR